MTMSSVLDRSELEQSPLADLHLLGNELGVDGFRRLRRDELIDAILARQSGGTELAGDVEVEDREEEDEEARKPRRGRRGGRGRGRTARSAEEGATDEDAGDDEAESEAD